MKKKYSDSLVGDFYNDSLYVFNTSDGSLDSIITIPELKFDKDIKQLSDGKAGFLAESSTITTRWGKPQKYIGQIDLNNYSSTFFPINPDFESYEIKIVDFNINKSYHAGFDKKVLLHSYYTSTGSVSAPFDSNLIRRHDLTHISRSLDSGCFWFNYNSKTIIHKPKYFQNDRYYAYINRFYDSKEENNKDLYIKEHKSDFSEFMGLSKDEEFVFYKSYLKEVPDSISKVIIIYDFENNSNIDSMIFRIKKHPIFGYRDFNNIKFLNDSIAIGVIRAGIIKFKFVLETTSVNDQENKEIYKLYPNQTTGNITYQFTNQVAGNLNWQVVDINGVEIISKSEFFKLGDNILNLNISYLANGIYFLNVGNNSIKIVLEK